MIEIKLTKTKSDSFTCRVEFFIDGDLIGIFEFDHRRPTVAAGFFKDLEKNIRDNGFFGAQEGD